MSKDLKVITKVVNDLKTDFDVELEESMDGRDISRFLGVDSVRNEDKSFEFRQPYLVQRILTLLEIDGKVKSHPIPVCKPLLHEDKDGEPRVRHWKYRSAIGMLNYLQGSTRPDISMAVL